MKFWLSIVLIIAVFLPSLLAEQPPSEGTGILYDKGDEEQYKEKLSRIEADTLKELKKLVGLCDKYKLQYDRKYIAEVLLALNPENEYGKELLAKVQKDKNISSLKARAAFATKLQKAREKASKKCSDLAKWCKSKKLDDAMEESIQLALKLHPHNKAARKTLGQVFLKGRGWLDKDVAKKIASGKRELDGKWRLKAQVDQLRKDWKNAWELKGEHFILKTNTSEEEGLRMLADAEELYNIFTHEFGRYLELKELSGIVINYYATKADYVANIPEGRRERFADTTGFADRTVIYMRKEPVPGTVSDLHGILRHEITHIFCFNRLVGGTSAGISNRPNYWLVEGIAVFMEPGAKKLAPGVYELGLPSKRKRDISRIAAGNFMPLSKFTTGGFSAGAESYAQAYALTHYLFTAESGKYRVRLFRLIQFVHSGKDDNDSFEKELGIKPSELDNKLREHCSKLMR